MKDGTQGKFWQCPGFGKRTLKALANFSPGFALKPWVENGLDRFFATLKELRGFCG
jgi:hypothetical protein